MRDNRLAKLSGVDEHFVRDHVHVVAHVMRIIGKYIQQNRESTSVEVVVGYTIPSVNANAGITVSNSANAIVAANVAGTTLFVQTANVGDMITYTDSVHPLRSFAKIITVVAANGNSLNVESNFIYVGQGRITTNGGNNMVVISGNVNAVSDFIQTSDVLQMNVNNTIIHRSVSGLSGNNLTLNTTISTSNTNVVYLVKPVYTDLAYEIIKVTE